MTRQQKAELERALQAERTRLNRRLGRHDTSTGIPARDRNADLVSGPARPGDDASDVTELELDSTLAARAAEMLAQVDEALHRLASGGRYGICESCGSEIAFGRMRLIPWARYCASCEIAGESGGR
jgi:RNA polymerase-binding transcription factor DksA